MFVSNQSQSTDHGDFADRSAAETSTDDDIHVVDRKASGTTGKKHGDTDHRVTPHTPGPGASPDGTGGGDSFYTMPTPKTVREWTAPESQAAKVKRENLYFLFAVMIFVTFFASIFFFVWGKILIGVVIFVGSALLGVSMLFIPALKAPPGGTANSSDRRPQSSTPKRTSDKGDGDSSGGGLVFAIGCVIAAIFVFIAWNVLDDPTGKFGMAVIVTGLLAILVGTPMFYYLLIDSDDDE